VRSADLKVLYRHGPDDKQALSAGSAQALQQMMVNVVQKGTGTKAQVSGVVVGGKTGTAQSDLTKNPYAWFVSFAKNPDIAIAVFIEDANVDRTDIAGGALAGTHRQGLDRGVTMKNSPCANPILRGPGTRVQPTLMLNGHNVGVLMSRAWGRGGVMVTAEQGTLLGGRYQLGPVLGRGGMAEVRRAVDTRLSRPVAIKILRIDLAGDSTFQARFRREAQAAAGLNHPNIVSVYDTGEQLDPASDVHIPYIVMELVVGHTLRDLLREGRKILPERALEMEMGVLDALQYSHNAGIIHRDIKPANVMLTSTGQVKVMDFGIARAVADTSASMTQTAAVIGTAQYLSPEQARGETVDNRSDVYAAGCLLYELLVGEPPFKGDSPVSVAYQHVRELPVRPSLIDPVITPDMDAITLKALEKDPERRYQSAKEMRDDIARLLAGLSPTAQLPVVPRARGGGRRCSRPSSPSP
jgi:hypothetical protein